MTVPPPVKSTPRRGRPRSTAARDAVLRAARQLLDDGGPGAVTIERVAERSGVSKPTIYRTWPNAQAVMMAALMLAPATPVGRSPRRRSTPGPRLRPVREHLRDLIRVFTSRTGRSVTLMLASAEAETELSKAFRHHVVLARREEGRRLLAAAITAGEVRADVQVDVVLDLLYGPVFARLLLGHAPLEEGLADAVVDHVLAGVGRKRTARR
jgi:AcrR family transcriptional regulator